MQENGDPQKIDVENRVIFEPENNDFVATIQKTSLETGRLDVATKIKAILRGVVFSKERILTPEEEKVWQLVNEITNQMGATPQDLEKDNK